MAAEPTSPVKTGGEGQSIHTPLGWALAVLSLGYTIFAYYGMGPPPGGLPTDLWHPRTFLLDLPVIGGWVDHPGPGAFVIALPNMLLTLGTFLQTRSAIARAMALSASVTTFLFALCGFAIPMAMAWEAFNWRFSWIMVFTGTAVGGTVTSPLLVRRWLALPRLAQAAIYLPIFFYLMAAVRGATGTSERMAFLVSPWPIFTVFGLESAVVIVCGLLAAIAIGILSLSDGFSHKLLVPIGVAIALLIPGSVVSSVVPEMPIAGRIMLAVVTAVAVGLGLLTRSQNRSEALQRRGIYLALGAMMVFIPVASGRALANGDYAVNRYVRAPMVIDALERHIEKEEFFPEKLEDLVEAGYLNSSPAPRIGFSFLASLNLAEEADYRFNEYGSSYILEFDSTEWVQCSYSGQYYFDEEEEEEEEEEDEFEEPSWNCLGKRPAFLSDEPTYEEEDEEYYDDE